MICSDPTSAEREGKGIRAPAPLPAPRPLPIGVARFGPLPPACPASGRDLSWKRRDRPRQGDPPPRARPAAGLELVADVPQDRKGHAEVLGVGVEEEDHLTRRGGAMHCCDFDVEK